MIICGQDSVAYVNIATQVVDTSGSPVAADAAPVASFYRADASTGTLALDILVGVAGAITMTAQAGVTGLYSCPLLLSSLLHKQYQVRITWAVSTVNHVQIQEIMLLTELDAISSDATTPAASVAYSVRA